MHRQFAWVAALGACLGGWGCSAESDSGDTGGDVDADADIDADADTDTGTGSGSGTGTGGDSDSDTDTDTGSETDSGTDTDTTTCYEGLLDCGAECVRPMLDEENCGDCGIVCDPATEAECVDGECTCGGVSCSGEPDDTCCEVATDFECLDTTTDRNHCGTCDGDCARDEDCVDSQCVEGEGTPCNDSSSSCEDDGDCSGDDTCYRYEGDGGCGFCYGYF